jgi:uncharacterized membrane protein
MTTMRKTVIATIVTILVFLAMDATWLTLTGDRLYRPRLGPLLAAKPDVAAAIAFYVIYLGGIVALAVRPGLEAGKLGRTALSAATLGLVAYATYDLTNQATLKLWSTTVTLCDLGWGVVVTTAAASAGYLAARTFGGK